MSPPVYNCPIAPEKNLPTSNQRSIIKVKEAFMGDDRMIRSGLSTMTG